MASKTGTQQGVGYGGLSHLLGLFCGYCSRSTSSRSQLLSIYIQYLFFVLPSVFITVVRSGKQGKKVRFLHVTFDTTGESFLAGDQHGNVYVFDISRNR